MVEVIILGGRTVTSSPLLSTKREISFGTWHWQQDKNLNLKVAASVPRVGPARSGTLTVAKLESSLRLHPNRLVLPTL